MRLSTQAVVWLLILMALGAGAVFIDPHLSPHQFYVVKGVVGLLGSILYLVHMNVVWPTLVTWGRRLRYLGLLAGSMLLTYASAEQITEQVPVDSRNRLGMLYGLLLLATAAVSLYEDRRGLTELDTRRGLPHD